MGSEGREFDVAQVGERVEAAEHGHEQGLADEDRAVGLREVEVVGRLIERGVELVEPRQRMKDHGALLDRALGVQLEAAVQRLVGVAEEGDRVHVDHVELGQVLAHVVGDLVVDVGRFELLGDILAERVGHLGDDGDLADVLLEEQRHEQERLHRPHRARGAEDARDSSLRRRPGWRRSARWGFHFSRANQSASAWVGCSPEPLPALISGMRRFSQDLLRGVGLGVPHDDEVGVGIEHFADVGERLALGLAGGAAVGDRDDLAVEPEDRALEAGPGAGRGLEEGGDRDLAVERVIGPDLDLLEDRGELAELGDLVEGELSGVEDVLALRVRLRTSRSTGLFSNRFGRFRPDGLGALGRLEDRADPCFLADLRRMRFAVHVDDGCGCWVTGLPERCL